jgi:hypothetical protein
MPFVAESMFAAELGRRMEEVYLLERLSVISIPLSQMHELIINGKTRFAEIFGYALHFDKALENLKDEGLICYERNTAYVLTKSGKRYSRKYGIHKRAIQSLEKENHVFLLNDFI